MAYKTEFTTFAVKKGKETRAEEWMQTLIARRQECIQTLEREGMHYECIFKCFRGDRMYLSWFSVQSIGGPDVQDSPHPIDKTHLEFWNECVDQDVLPEDHEHVVSFVPVLVEQAVLQRDVP